jgi:integral membrane sensor domain MASE1/anti-sigma regulatory factor (Ser/Thr protein kinase)
VERRRNRDHSSAFARSSRDVLLAAGVAVAYYVAATLSLRLALVEENVTPLWPPTGIAVSAFLLFGRRLWPAVSVAALLVNLPITTSWAAAVATAAGNTAAPLVAATLLQTVGFRRQLDRLRDAVALVFLAALGSMTISASVGATTLAVTEQIAVTELPVAWSVWWVGDAMGVLVVAPFLLTFGGRGDRPIGRRRALEAAGLFALLGGVTAVALRAELPLLFLVPPLLGLVAWRFRQAGAAPGALLVSVLATWTAVEMRGPFATGDVVGSMLTLQAFNATVAFVSFVFAALVTERARTSQALASAAAELESRVRDRTRELSTANARLVQRERQLAEAQRLARLGSWEWDLGSGEVTWSDEMFRIHGAEPGSFPVTFDRAIELVPESDRARIRANVERGLARTPPTMDDIDYTIVRPDGRARTLHGSATVHVAADGTALRLVGSVQDVTDRRRRELDRRTVEILQQALLPEELPPIEGFSLAARYVPAEPGAAMGGDWYDVIPRPDGCVVLVIGDVAGHGVEAANVMAQVRMAVRAHALGTPEPASTVRATQRLIRDAFGSTQMVGLGLAVLDRSRREAAVVLAGLPPPIVVGSDGKAELVDIPVGLPLGVGAASTSPYESSSLRLDPGSTLLLYTDGLVDRRDRSLDVAFERLRAAASRLGDADLGTSFDAFVGRVLDEPSHDDVAVLAARLEASADDRLRIWIDADPSLLSPLRERLRVWLAGMGASPEVVQDVVLACSEACANVIQHAYGARGGRIEIDLEVRDGDASLSVRDFGSWRAPRPTGGGGRGLHLIEATMDQVRVDRAPGGTRVVMRRLGRVPT